MIRGSDAKAAMERILTSSTGVNCFWFPSSSYTILPEDCLWRDLVAYCRRSAVTPEILQVGCQPQKSGIQNKTPDVQRKSPRTSKPVPKLISVRPSMLQTSHRVRGKYSLSGLMRRRDDRQVRASKQQATGPNKSHVDVVVVSPVEVPTNPPLPS